VIVGSSLVAFAGWTVLVVDTGLLSGLDASTRPPPIDVLSPVGQIAAAVALLTMPALVSLSLVGVALWAFRRRLRRLSAALLTSVVLGWGGSALLRLLVSRPRPSQALDLVTVSGYGYPSGHLTAAVVAVTMITATSVVTRRSPLVRQSWQLGGAIGIVVTGLDQWLLSAHFVTDLIGGVLLGALVATSALVVADVHVLPVYVTPVTHPAVTEGRQVEPVPAKQCAVIFNPAKVTDWVTFRRHVDYELDKLGFADTLWLETTVKDPGRQMAAEAVRHRVDLVLGAGGDGTIRAVCAGLADSGIPFGLIPAGTGNLLARNLGIPLDERAALEIAFFGIEHKIDLVKLSVDDNEPDYFAVMAGLGIDAVILGNINPDLKRTVGSAAYFVSAMQQAKHPGAAATFTVDDAEPFKRNATVMVIGNVGYLQADIPLIPDAQADDGLLDLLIASPRRPADWFRLTARVLARQRRTDDRLARFTARKVTIQVEEPDEYQLDGDTIGSASKLVAEIAPGALTIKLPR